MGQIHCCSRTIASIRGTVSIPCSSLMALVGMPKVNIYGAPIGTVVCFLVITVLDLFCLNRVVRRPPKVLRLMLKPAVACAAMGAAAFFVNRLLSGALSPRIACLGAIVAAAAVYCVMVVALRIITYADCLLLPKGKKIAKILKIR